MIRQVNPVDFWRGIALVSIFINHIPGIYYSRFTHTAYSISDSADLFVFLAGWALRYMVGTPSSKMPAWYLALRLWGRAITLYMAQIVITMIALAILAGVALWLNNPLLLEWHNAAAVFNDPGQTLVGLALITHQLGYFNILPLYVLLMTMAPVFVLVDRVSPHLVLPLSLLIYGLTLGFQVSIPTWPIEGEWFFNPLAWQLLFVLGFVLAREDGIGGLIRRNMQPIRLIALPILIIGVFLTYYGWWIDPTEVPTPKLYFLLSKTYATPPRVFQFLALIAVMSVTYPYIKQFASWLVAFLAMLGRNSLYVFCISSILSLAGQIVRFLYQGSVYIDTTVVISGILIMAFTAWLLEWRKRFNDRISLRVAVSSS